MTRTAAATRTSTSDSSSLSTSSTSSAASESSTESTADVSVIPPAYMSTSETLGASTPNYSSIDSEYSSYCSSMSDDLASMSMPESATSFAEDISTEETSEEANAEDVAVEETISESSEDSEDETSEEEASEEEAVSEEESVEAAMEETNEEVPAEEEAAAEEGEGEGEEAEEDSEDESSESGGGGSNEEEAEGIEAIVTKLPRMAPIRTPYVGSAPPQAIERRDEIIKRTGSPPELHHAKVRQSVEHVAQAARDAQRRMVWAIGNVAKDTRISIEEMADEIMAAASAAVAQINGAIDTAMADIDTAAQERTDYMDDCTLLTGDDLEANRNFTNEMIATSLTSGSENVTALNEVATGRFDTYLGEAEGKIFAIPEGGTVGRIANPSAGASSGGGGDPVPQAGDRTADYQIMEHADESLVSFIDTKSREVGSRTNSANYYSFRSTPVLEGMESRTQTQLVQGAQEKAETLSSPATRAQFLVMLLGLITPVSKYHEEDQTSAVDENERELLSQMTEAEAAHYRANQVINQKRDNAKEYADRDLRENLTDNIWKAGSKGAKGLRKQAATAEVTLNNNAVPMAEAYRDLVERLNALLPPGQFLDSRELVPKLMVARENARQLQAQHESMAKEQALATEAQMQEVKKQQIEGLFKAANDSAQSITDVVTQTSFDMEVFVMQMTGSMREGAGACMTAAQDYADRTAEGILNSITGSSGPGMDRVNSVAVNFLNGQISAAEQAQFQQLAAFVESMENPAADGPLTKPMFDAQEDLHNRSTAIDNAMPERSTGTAIALGVVSPVAMGVYLYCTDPSENTVVTQLGGLMWPGILALEEVFQFEQGHGSLQGRIRDRLDDPEKTDALNLFSTTDSVRANARMSIVNNSTHWYSDYNRESREAVLSGMSGSERATLDATQLDEVRETITSDLDVHQRDISLAYLEGNRERAVAARTREALDEGVSSARWGWIFSAEEAQRRSDQARVDAIAGMDAMLRRELAVENAFANSMTTQELAGSTNDVYREFASLTDPRRRSADSFSAADGRNSLINYATQSHASVIININPLAGPMLSSSVAMVGMSAEANAYITNAINHGNDSDEARAARGVYEIARARTEGGSPSETTQTRLSDALENRTLASLERDANDMTKTPAERSRAARLLEEERVRHRARLQDMARGLGAPEDVAGDPVAAEAWMRDQVGDLFAETDSIFQTGPSHRRYGEEMITMGRASLDASVALATDGIGTHDDLLTRGYTDRSHAEIDAANARWSEEHGGESMEEMLGLRNGRDSNNRLRGDDSWWSGFGAETSGDQAMGLEVLALGNPENDTDRIAIANLRYEHQRVRGTGFIAERSMVGTDEQRFLDGSRVDMARVILAEAVRRNPELAGRFDDNPLAIFNADGTINSEVEVAAFEDGNFRGSTTELHNATAHIGYAADAYRAEIDRQESMLTTGITVLALIASLVLMCIPGVNIVAAGIISAVIAGAATIAVKAGMRGDRYGWEEAATDVAQTVIEAAAAGVGGAISRGMEEGVTAATKLGRLASFGRTLSNRLGSFGGAVAREALVGAASTAAQTAIQDDIWKDGLGAGIQRVANGAIRGAAVSAVTTVVSEGVTRGFTRPRTDANGLELASLSDVMDKRMGTHASEILRETINNTAGTVVGEAVGVGIDYAQGNFHGSFADALRQIGEAGLRELITSSVRSHIQITNRNNFNRLMDAAQRGGNLTHAELHALRAFGISAGVFHYDQGIDHVRGEVLKGRVFMNTPVLAQVPPNLRQHLMHLDGDSLGQLVHFLNQGGDAHDAAQVQAFMAGVANKIPGVNTEMLMGEFAAVMANRRVGESTLAPEQQHQLRNQLADQLHPEYRAALEGIAVEGLQHLSPEHLAQAAEMIAKGNFDFDTADNLLRAAKASNPDLDAVAFLQNLHGAVSRSRQLQDTVLKDALERHRNLVALVPEEAGPIFAKLDAPDVIAAMRLIHSGDPGTPQQQDALFRAAQAKNPELTRDQFISFMTHAAGEVQQRRVAEAHAERTARAERMTDIQEELRATLSLLPEVGMVELRLRQQEGGISPHERNRLIEMAKLTTPDIDVRLLGDAIDQAMQSGLNTRVSDAESLEMRRHLLSGVPADQRDAIENTHIIVLSDAEFAAMTRSNKGQAVTLIIDGNPVVVIREGADPRVLREEGIHAMQAKDPAWKEHIGALDESRLAHWDSLPLEEQIELYRNKVALELDAQQRMIALLEADIVNAGSPQEKAALQRQLDQVQQAHANLSKRMHEVGGIDAMDIANIKAGFSERPQWLDQPARLFNKESLTEEQRKYRDSLLTQLTGDLKSGGDAEAKWRKHAADALDLSTLERLVNLHPDPRLARDILNHAIASGNPKGFIDQAHQLAARIGPHATLELIRTEHGRKLLTSLANAGATGALDRLINHCSNIEELRGVLVRLGSSPDPAKLTNHLNNVLSLLTDNQSFEFVARLSKMEIANAADHIEAFSHITRNINDPTQVQAFMHLVSRLNASEYFDFVLKWGIISNGLFPQLEQNLPDFYKGKLLSRLIEMAATQRDWKVFFNEAHDLLNIVNELSKNPANKDAVEQVMRYLLNPYGDPVHLAADVLAAVDQLRDPATRDAVFALQLSRLAGPTGHLAGSDTWHSRLENEAIKWNAFRTDPATSDFANFLKSHPDTAGWSDGQLGAISNMHKWFEHLAQLRGIKPGDMSPEAVAARNALLTEIFNRGFGPGAAHSLSSVGKLVDLNRAFREMVVEAATGIDLRNLGATRDPNRVAAALKRAGISEEDFAHFSDAQKEVLLQHLYTLQARHEFYSAMGILEETLGGGAHGIQQNITEVEGEFALASHIVLNEPDSFRLAIPFAKGTGFDQVWVGRGPNGEPVYIIGEAKGAGAELGAPIVKGPQMSAEWVANTLREMLTSSNASERQLAQDIIKAIANERDARARRENPVPAVRGVIIEAGVDGNKAGSETGRDGYNFELFNDILGISSS